ncbi:ShlB/FhaC/HecB family hemolysin secretion/activation protein [Yersinia pseudotuberculosis]|uniref:ShlB/FhaC/HecB family hemolysin secretion/activation protein n=1 Tax=Yersinia pseudotuberculosis TaxID=633 RepID=UPI00403763AE
MIRKRTALWLVLSTGAQAETPLAIETPSSINESRQSLQNNAKEINQLVEEKRHQQITQHNTGQSELSRPENPAAPELPEDTQCLPINGVYIQGITLLTEDDLNELSAIPEQCIHPENINLLTRELTNIYMDKGYITARIQFIPPDADGKLGLDITEGFVEAIDSMDTGLDGETVFPNMIGKPLNITRLDQGLDQANRLPSNKVTVDILPGTLPGGSILKLHNTPSTPWHLTTSMDNYGNKNTGEWLNRNALSFDNPLGLSDSVSVNISNTVDRPQRNYSRAYSMFYSVPYGALTFSGFGSYAEYRYPLKLQFNTAKLHGETQQHGLRADYVFYRDQSQINGLSAQLTYKRASNYLNDEKIAISSPTLTIFELGLNHLHVLPMGLFNINVSLEQGLPWLGAEHSNGPLANYQDIVEPSASGLSHNQFQDFNVGEKGAVLNNATSAGNSILAGQLAANQNLNGQAASIILNEVISRNPSLLLGQQEIFGMTADYILANPNGITCNGCGFMNTNRESLVVGNPLIEQGSLKGFETFNNYNWLKVQDKGLTANKILDLIAPKIEVTGSVTSTEAINALSGSNRVSLDGTILLSRPIPFLGKDHIDGKYLGSMQSGRINLVSTLAGSGVKIAGSLNASEAINATIKGTLQLEAAKLDGNDINIKANSIQAFGNLHKNEDNGDITQSLERTQLKGKNIAIVANKKNQLSAVKIDADNVTLRGGELVLDGQKTTQTQTSYESEGGGWWLSKWSKEFNTKNEQEEQIGSTITASNNAILQATDGAVRVKLNWLAGRYPVKIRMLS